MGEVSTMRRTFRLVATGVVLAVAVFALTSSDQTVRGASIADGSPDEQRIRDLSLPSTPITAILGADPSQYGRAQLSDFTPLPFDVSELPVAPGSVGRAGIS